MFQFKLPDPGEGLLEAEITQWLVSEGDEVRINDVLVEIETAKSLVELPSPVSGRIVRLLAAVGQTVEVGTPIIEIDDGSETSAEVLAGGEPRSPGDDPSRPAARGSTHPRRGYLRDRAQPRRAHLRDRTQLRRPPRKSPSSWSGPGRPPNQPSGGVRRMPQPVRRTPRRPLRSARCWPSRWSAGSPATWALP